MAHESDTGHDEVDSAVRAVEELRDWYEGLAQAETAEPTFADEFARAAARRRLDERPTRTRRGDSAATQPA